MTAALLGFIAAGGILIVAAAFLTRAADTIADRSGLGRVWMGAVLLAAATSLPELAVDISAVRQGAADLAAGDLFGSSMFNMLILAVMGILPPRDEIFRRASLDLTLSAALAITMHVVAAVMILSQSSAVLAGVSPGALVLLVLFVVGSHAVYRQQHDGERAGPPSSGDRSKAEGAGAGPRASLRGSIVSFAVATAVILLIAPRFASNAQQIADLSGLGLTFFGTLFVGASTSLPEIVTCVAALRMGAFDLAVGNLFGSNVFT